MDESGATARIESREQFEAWLRQRPGEEGRRVAVLLAARSALRVLPLVANFALLGGGQVRIRQFVALTAMSFRASALARGAGKYPTRANAFYAAADAAAAAAYASRAAAAAADASRAAAVAADASRAAAAAAAYAAAYAADAAASRAAAAAAAAAYAADAAAAAAAYAAAADDASRAAYAAATWNALNADIALLATQGSDALVDARLWLSGAPNWAVASWSKLRAALPPDENWQVWLDWYEDCLAGRTRGEARELVFASVPQAEWDKGPAAANAWIKEELEKIAVSSPPPSPPLQRYDFFLSYSSKNEVAARFVDEVLIKEGFSVFAQFRNMPPGSNFVREMNEGLKRSEKMIALISPDYIASDHCQAEWSSVYASDAGGLGRKLIPLLVAPADLEPLMRQVVYTSLLDLPAEKAKAAILNAVAASELPQPADAPAAAAYEWNDGKLKRGPGPQNTPFFPYPENHADHQQWLDACRTLAARLIADLKAQKFQVHGAYAEGLSRYLEDLPQTPGQGNFVLADAEIRSLRDDFEQEAEALPGRFPSRLNRILDLHDALRGFYPEFHRLVDAVQTSKANRPFPEKAAEGVARTVQEHTPGVFDPPILEEIDDAGRERKSHAAPQDTSIAESGIIRPKPDPLGPINPTKSRNATLASAINALWKTFLKGKDIPEALEGWRDVAGKLGENVGPVIDWLKDFLSKRGS